MGKPGAKPRRLQDPSWSAEVAYACGLMATDGCLLPNGRHLNLTSNDLDQLETFKKCLNLKANISWKKSGYTGRMNSQIQFGDVVLHKWFRSIGLTPNKTKTIGKLNIPDEYFFDYLRGEFDGDGSSHAYWDTRWRSSVSLYLKFTCASAPHLEWLNDSIFKFLAVKGYIQQAGGVYALTFSKQKAKVLYKAMYYSTKIPFLKRKKDKLDRQWVAAKLAHEEKRSPLLVRSGSILRIA